MPTACRARARPTPKHHKRKLHDLSPRIQLDNERCILCSRCVRFTREISKSNMLGIVERGAHAFVERVDPDVRRRPVLGQRHRPVPDGRPAVARLPLPEPRVVSRAGAFGVHGLLARLQHRSVAAQEGVAAALARRGAQQHAVPRHRPREPRDQRSLALQQGLRPAQADEQGADADADARRRAGIDRTGARPGPRPDRASAQSGRPRLGARLQRGARRLQGDARRALARLRARGQRRRSPGRWSRTTS